MINEPSIQKLAECIAANLHDTGYIPYVSKKETSIYKNMVTEITNMIRTFMIVRGDYEEEKKVKTK